MNDLFNMLNNQGPQSFNKDLLAKTPDLFQQRAALFFTETSSIPENYIGHGHLDVRLPLPLPTYHESLTIRAHREPRLWVDLLQRITGKIRWKPTHPAKVTIIRLDTYGVSPSDYMIKALLDSLKVKTTGRRDGLKLFYFGAIVEDDAWSVETHIYQNIVQTPKEIGCRVIVEPITSNKPPYDYYAYVNEYSDNT